MIDCIMHNFSVENSLAGNSLRQGEKILVSMSEIYNNLNCFLKVIVGYCEIVVQLVDSVQDFV